jgi:hypothetical protein
MSPRSSIMAQRRQRQPASAAAGDSQRGGIVTDGEMLAVLGVVPEIAAQPVNFDRPS